jgi:outer membrane protein OmpA-like peptidoglycan-associated protein
MTRIIYHVLPGHTVLELLRNYEHALADAGLAQTAERLPFADRIFAYQVYHQGWQAPSGADAVWLQWGEVWQQMAYVTAKGAVAGQDVNGAVWVGNHNKAYDVDFGHGPIHFMTDDPTVIVDVVAKKSVDINMVTVKASDIADALATKGTIDLYGILFDVDKTDVKPESSKTLDEVASLMKIDRSLKLEISGHTDNTGEKDHNLKLSEGRAQAVVDVLTKKYGIDAARLAAKGYGDTKPVAPNDSEANKAKNRRVE